MGSPAFLEQQEEVDLQQANIARQNPLILHFARKADIHGPRAI